MLALGGSSDARLVLLKEAAFDIHFLLEEGR